MINHNQSFVDIKNISIYFYVKTHNYLGVGDEYHFTCMYPTYIKIRVEYQGILGPSPILSKLLDTPSVKRLGRYILELKQHRENKLQSVNHNPFTTHQHVTSVIFQ